MSQSELAAYLETKRQFLRQAKLQLNSFLVTQKRLEFPKYGKPTVSVLVVSYKQTALELLCFMSVLRWMGSIPFELIIVNNGTEKEHVAFLSRLINVKLIHNTTNLGFVKAVNIGARAASGEFLLLLNDDAILSYEAPSFLLAALEGWEQTKRGVVGGQVRTLDGRIQDAGGILWSTGEAAEYSKGRNPDIGDVNFVREVDYVSGALFMTPLVLFKEFGGFDEQFSPGYCEESDYCVRLRQAGYKVVYTPQAKILHYEYGSSESSAVSTLVKEHTQLLVTKHSSFLAQREHPSTPTVYARSTKNYRGHVLIVTEFVPQTELGDAKLLEFIGQLSENDFFVTLFPINSGVHDWMSVYKDLPDTVEVMLYENIKELDRLLAERPRFYDYGVVKSYPLKPLMEHFEAKYLIKLNETEDYDSPRLKAIVKPTLLWVDWHIPEFDTNAGDYAVYNYCNQFKELGFKIRYWSDDPSWPQQNKRYTQQLLKEDWDIWNLGYSFEQTISDLGHTVDLIVLGRPLADKYIKFIRAWTSAPIIYYCHDLHYLREGRRLSYQNSNGLSPDDLTYVNQLKETELRNCDKSDLVVTVSEYERALLEQEGFGGKVVVWPWYCPPVVAEARSRSTITSELKLLFIGGLQHTPNQTAVLWLVDTLLPTLANELKVSLTVVGGGATEDILALNNEKTVHIVGHQEDLEPWINQASVLVAPIYFGAGFKGKIALAMSYGLPVITTTLGAEGMGLTGGKNVLIANSVDEFIECLMMLTPDYGFLSKNGLEYAAKHWSAEAVQTALKNSVEVVGVHL